MSRLLAAVSIAGGTGGFVGWIYSVTIGQPLKLGAGWAIPASIVLGAGAGVIGFYLADPDRQDMLRVLAFAFMCGVSWRPVYEAANSYVERLPEVKKEQRAADAAERLDRTLVALPTGGAGGPEAAVRAREVGAATNELLALSDKLVDGELRAEYGRRASAAMGSVARAAASPEEKTGILAEVGQQAAERGQVVVALEAAKNLDLTARTTPDPRVRSFGDRALTEMQELAVRRGDVQFQRGLEKLRAPRPE